MKYSLDASVLEIRKRRDARLREQKRRSVGAFSGSTALCVARRGKRRRIRIRIRTKRSKNI